MRVLFGAVLTLLSLANLFAALVYFNVSPALSAISAVAFIAQMGGGLMLFDQYRERR